MDFNRLECQDILATLDSRGVHPNVSAKLVAGACGAIEAPSAPVSAVSGSPGFHVPYGIGFRPATQSELDALKKIQREGSES